MKKSMIAVFLIVTTLLGLFTLPVYAEENEQKIPSLQFLTEDSFSSESNGGWETLYAAGDDFLVWSPDGRHAALVDVFGNILIPAAKHTRITQLKDWLFYAMNENNLAALYMKTTRLTDYIYSFVEVEGEYVRCEKKGGVDYYSLSGQKMPLPKIPDGWTLVTIVGGEAAIIKALNYSITIDGNPTWKYAMCNYKGEIIRASRSNYEIEKIYGTEKLVRVIGVGIYTYVDTKGKTLLESSYGMNVNSEGRGFMIKDNKGICYVYDNDLNLLWSEKVKSAQYFSADKVLITDTEGNAVLKTLAGEELLCAPCDLVQLPCSIYINRTDRTSYNVGQPDNWGFTLLKGDTATLYNKDAEVILTLSGVEGIRTGEAYLVVYYPDGKKECYDNEGRFIFSYDSDRSLQYASGVLLEKNNIGYAICNSKGERITDFIYRTYLDCGAYGIITMIRRDNDERYAVNIAGEILNEKPLLNVLHFYGPITAYQCSEGYGIVRYVGPEDSRFADVKATDWFLEGVEFCAENELFSGTAFARFSPEDYMTRAMLVTVLWRLEGEPSAQTQATFSDVKEGSWYAEAVSWAAECGIVNGMSEELFAPDGYVTREQIATIMLRYSHCKEYDTEARTDISSYADAKQVSPYACDAMSWANAAGLINGSNENGKLLLLPQGNATRAQVATILMRFVQSFVR